MLLNIYNVGNSTVYIVYRISLIVYVYHETCSRRLPFIEFVVCYVCMCVGNNLQQQQHWRQKKTANRERRTNDTQKIGIKSIIYLVGSQRTSIETPMKCLLKREYIVFAYLFLYSIETNKKNSLSLEICTRLLFISDVLR